MDLIGDSSNEDLSKIKQDLDRIHSKLDAIDNKLSQISGELTDEIRTTHYKTHSDKIYLLEAILKDFLSVHNEATKDRLLDGCRRHDMTDTINWIFNEITGSPVQSFMTVMKRDNDRKKFFKWSKIIISKFMQAIILHEACFGARYSGSSETLISTTRYDSERFSTQLKGIADAIRIGDEEIEKNFWDQAIIDIEYFMARNGHLSNEEFSHSLYEKLNDKYNWRYWFIGSYNGDTSGFHEHASVSRYNEYFRFWIRQHNRNLLVASPQEASDEWRNMVKNEIESCLKCGKYDQNNLSLSVLEKLQNCISDRNSISVVKFGNGLRSSGNGAFVFINKQVEKEDWDCPGRWSIELGTCKNVCKKLADLSIIVTK